MRKQGHTPEGWTRPTRKLGHPGWDANGALNAMRHGTSTAPARSTTAAVLLSLLLVGAGHIYAGSPARGLVWLFGGLLLAILTAGIAAPFIYIFAACDAASVAKAAR